MLRGMAGLFQFGREVKGKLENAFKWHTIDQPGEIKAGGSWYGSGDQLPSPHGEEQTGEISKIQTPL
jgi:hypothetical protein